MEVNGRLSEAQKEALPIFCEAMAKGLADLVRQMSPRVTPRDVSEMPLLTIGSQFQGSNNNTIGKRAAQRVFSAISEIVKPFTTKREQRKLTLRNAAKRTVLITLMSDPDVCVQEHFGQELHNKVALEIKGGTDKSNAHNRAGEAEKSHVKARKLGFRDFGTIIAKKGLDMQRLQRESPTTTSWFDVSQVLGREGEDWEEFRSRLAGEVGIPLRW
jgi:hypothetical protein